MNPNRPCGIGSLPEFLDFELFGKTILLVKEKFGLLVAPLRSEFVLLPFKLT